MLPSMASRIATAKIRLQSQLAVGAGGPVQQQSLPSFAPIIPPPTLPTEAQSQDQSQEYYEPLVQEKKPAPTPIPIPIPAPAPPAVVAAATSQSAPVVPQPPKPIQEDEIMLDILYIDRTYGHNLSRKWQSLCQYFIIGKNDATKVFPFPPFEWEHTVSGMIYMGTFV